MLGIPLSEHKTCGPETRLEYLGLILDSNLMRCELPEVKLVRIRAMIADMIPRESVTKVELLRLLGHLNFASRVIPAGRPFVAYLLTLANSVQELHHHVKFNADCRQELRMWMEYLESWNGISLFQDPSPTLARSLKICLDSSSAVCVGVFDRNWFQFSLPAKWETYPGCSHELMTFTLAAIIWGERWQCKRLVFPCRFRETAEILRRGRSSIHPLNKLMRILVLTAARNNFVMSAEKMSPFRCGIAGLLSNFQMDLFRHAVPLAETTSAPFPPILYDIWSLDPVITNLWESSLSGNTRSAYQSGMNCFIRFIALHGISQSPHTLSEQLFIYFVAFCSKTRNFRYTTIKLYLAGIRHFYIEVYGIDPFLQADKTPFLRLPLILRSIKRIQIPLPIKRKPITASILRDMCQVLDSTRGICGKYVDNMLSACITLAFFAFLRCGEFCVNGVFDPESDLSADAIDWGDYSHSYFRLRLKRSKTDAFRSGVNIHVTKLGPVNPICPVRHMDNYLLLRHAMSVPLHGPLFVYEGVALSRSNFIRLMRIVLIQVGHHGDDYNGHSFRSGAATSCASAKIQDHEIKLLGRWASNSYQRYIRTPLSSIANAQQRMSTAP